MTDDGYVGNSARPVTVIITATFPKKGARKVVPADIEKAATAAAMAFRAHLQAREPAYEVLDLEVDAQYSYILASTSEAL